MTKEEQKCINMIYDMLQNNIRKISKNSAGADLIMKAQSIILDEDRAGIVDCPYLFPTHNHKYLNTALTDAIKKAFIILSSGDTLFELLLRGIKDITAVDRNDLQVLTYKLKIAAFKTLSAKDFEKFMINPYNTWFMHKDIAKRVTEALKNDEVAYNFWNTIFINPPEDLAFNFFGGVLGDDFKLKQSLTYLHNKPSFYELRDLIEKSNIKIEKSDAFNYLLTHPQEKFDYIDFNNILLFVFQLACECDLNKFQMVLEDMKDIYNKNLNVNGTMVLDYMFGTDVHDFERANRGRKLVYVNGRTISDLYKYSFEYFQKNFGATSFSVSPLMPPDAIFGTPIGDVDIIDDTVVLTRKLAT